MATLAAAQCPFANPGVALKARSDGASVGSRDHMRQYEVDDSDVYMTSDVAGPIADMVSLKAGIRGSTLLEDFILRQKITRFDHERVPERVVHARGAGAYGTFTSYGDFSNLTAASFLSEEEKTTPIFVRFSTVVGSRGSADTVRDVHGFAVRLYGNFDMVGNNIPVFFINDAAQFPDLIHSVKPRPDKEIPQAATAHDAAWDFFSQQTTSLHTLFWAMSGHGIPRSFRHMDGFGVNTYRFVNDAGESKLAKWHFKTQQGLASLVWEEAQVLSGKNADYHRQDLWDAIESGHGPEWEVSVQIVNEEDVLAYGFDLLDPTKILPVEDVPLQPLGRLKLDANPVNFFAETEQIMFQPGHVVRGIDFSDDPLLQGRLFSYLDTQLSRHGGPNFEQVPINRPIPSVHNNNRDGQAQNLIHRNNRPYSPNTLNNGSPRQANQTHGRGFFTAPGRTAVGNLVREVPDTFSDHWSQTRLFYNSLTPVEQQQLINAIRFETSNVESDGVKRNVLTQLNKVSNDIANRVASFLGHDALEPDGRYYHDNTTSGVSTARERLPSIATLKVGILSSVNSEESLRQAQQLKERFGPEGVVVTVVGERLGQGIDMTYNHADATGFDGVIVGAGAEALFDRGHDSPLYPAGRPLQIVSDAYRWGKPVGELGTNASVLSDAGISSSRDGVYTSGNADDQFVRQFSEGLATFRFTDRFPMDSTTAGHP
ncbi:catalase-3 [Sodiomyces alkalinus F11]|uniref:Catalase n=1 Tax=Sodiomyces alkalinus (strain CBS 110278 / VKM F-3762 / F11) TaxID=1314773 RepID=A0A3N2Q1C0_SODAK|nr:catalase-3 [Sodiomyces alkalinus F11]ROT40488.1 catalase-3 [Sodiomyces alkalinus F11]